MGRDERGQDLTIWAFALGYFLCYVPYSAITKALSKGLLEGMSAPLAGPAILPLSVAASTVGMLIFLTAMRWWRFASVLQVGRLKLPHPGLWTGLSGLCTALIVVTTTLAYTFEGVSIVFVMLLMRGGVLVIAPLIDALSGRRTRWFSWVGLALSLAALLAAFSENDGYDITFVCAVDVFVYILSYFIRLRFMSRLAKSRDPNLTKRYFVEEQMVATPAVLLALVIGALVGEGDTLSAIRYGFVDIWSSPIWPMVIVVGFLSQGTGVFGGLILLDRRENTYCVPVNRSSSILAGVMASLSLSLFFESQRAPSSYELLGTGFILAAILFLTLPPMLERKAAP